MTTGVNKDRKKSEEKAEDKECREEKKDREERRIWEKKVEERCNGFSIY